MDNIWQKGKDQNKNEGSKGDLRSGRTFGEKIIWERDEDNGWESRPPKSPKLEARPARRRADSGWNYDRYYQPFWGGSNLKKVLTNKFLIQTVVSLLIFMIALGIYDRQDPGSQVASRMVQYLLNVDVNFEPVLGRIVKLVFPELTDSPLTPNGGVMPAATTPGQTGTTTDPNQANTDPNQANTDPAQANFNAAQTNPVIGTGSTLDPLSTDTTAPASLVKLAIPVNGTVTKKFGWVADATTGIKRYHEGIDIKAPEKSKVSSILDGKVTKLGEDPDLGKYIIITHDGDLVSLYGQLAQVNVKQSELVKAGDVIGLVGKTGTAREPHLHLEIREKGEAIDPWLKLSKEGI